MHTQIDVHSILDEIIMIVDYTVDVLSQIVWLSSNFHPKPCTN